MKKILILLVLLVSVSCVKIENNTQKPVTFGYFTDSYYYTPDYLILIECSVSPFLEGEDLVQVWIHNEVYSIKEKEFTLDVELSNILTTNNFQRELHKTAEKPRYNPGVSFVTNYRGLEITWKMFDEIYERYAYYR